MMEQRPADVNERQWQAINHKGSHLLIVAGPGTGKTHTLTYRIAKTAEGLQENQQILAITFTHKAADEMKERLSRRFPVLEEKVFIGTFHRFCLQFLREHIHLTNLPRNFQVAAPHEIELLVRHCWPHKTNKQQRDKIEEISQWKSAYFDRDIPEDIISYNAFLRDNNFLDYDDLLWEAWKILSLHPQERYASIFVDEYQDINPLQHALLKVLVVQGAKITAIGDPNQAIYGFRGAHVQFFKSFLQDFPPAATLSLTNNYRSVSYLLKASGQVMAAARGESFFIPELTADIYKEGKLTVYEAPTDKAEAEYVVHQIEKMVGGTSMFSQDSGRVETDATAERSFGDVAVLYRLNSQKNLLEEALSRSGIPYQVSGDKTLLELPPLPEVVAFLRLSLGQTISAAAGSHLMRLLMVQMPGEIQGAADQLKATDAASALQALKGLPLWKNVLRRHERWMEHINALESVARRFQRLEDFLDEITLQRPEDVFDPRVEKVHLLTLHAAKGLEFPVVFIVGCEEGLLPLRQKGFKTDLQEERRLFYVGMTRAKEALFLTHARRRRLWGQILNNQPSAFLENIEKSLKQDECCTMVYQRKGHLESKQLQLFE